MNEREGEGEREEGRERGGDREGGREGGRGGDRGRGRGREREEGREGKEVYSRCCIGRFTTDFPYNFLFGCTCALGRSISRQSEGYAGTTTTLPTRAGLLKQLHCTTLRPIE